MNPFAALGIAILAAFGAPGQISVQRRAAGTYDPATGLWTPGAITTLTPECAVQPSGPKELQQLPELERTIESITIYTLAALQSSDVSQGLEADVVTYAGRTWKVRSVRDWVSAAGYARAVCQRLGE